jgi:hypothetical protein
VSVRVSYGARTTLSPYAPYGTTAPGKSMASGISSQVSTLPKQRAEPVTSAEKLFTKDRSVLRERGVLLPDGSAKMPLRPTSSP